MTADTMTPTPTPTPTGEPPASERRTFYRIEGDPPTCVAREFDQRGEWFYYNSKPLHLGCYPYELHDLRRGGFADSPVEAWVLANEAAREAYYAAENARLKARERWEALHEARCAAVRAAAAPAAPAGAER